MDYTIEFSKLAELDIVNIFEHISKDSLERAADFVGYMQSEIQKLTNSPQKCREYNGKRKELSGCRILVIKNYNVYYTIINNKVYIIQILHSAQNQ